MLYYSDIKQHTEIRNAHSSGQNAINIPRDDKLAVIHAPYPDIVLQAGIRYSGMGVHTLDMDFLVRVHGDVPNHRFRIPDGCHLDDLRNITTDIGQSMAEIMRRIERENPETLSGIFSSFDDAKWADKTKLTD